jgi:hypothetical protein
MRRLYIIIVLCLLFSATNAQDIIQRTDGVKIEGKVLDANGAEIRFNKAAEPPENVYIIQKEDVSSITYQDGTVQEFNTSAPRTPVYTPSAPSIPLNQGQHILAIRPIDLIFPNISLLYEHLSVNKKFGIRFPISIGLGSKGNRTDVYDTFSMLRNRTFGTGVDLNFYVGRPDRFKYYVGPSFQLGFFRYQPYYNSYPGPSYSPTLKTGTHYAFLLNNGLWYQISRQAMLGMDIGLGVQKRVINRDTNYYYQERAFAKLSGNITIGFQF